MEEYVNQAIVIYKVDFKGWKTTFGVDELLLIPGDSSHFDEFIYFLNSFKLYVFMEIAHFFQCPLNTNLARTQSVRQSHGQDWLT